MIRTATLLSALFLAVSAAAGGDDMETAYFAPVNQLIFKVVWPGGGVREFERDLSAPERLRSTDGWKARLVGDEDGKVDVFSPKGIDGQRDVFRFDRGRLVRIERGGETNEFAYGEVRPAPQGAFPPLLVTREMTSEAAREYSFNEFLHKWDGSGRLAFPFVNPNQNGVLYAELFLLFLCLAFSLKRRFVRPAFAALAMLAASCLVWTMSRGAWLGAVVGTLCFAVTGLRRFLKSRLFWASLGIVVVSIAVWVFLFGSAQITRGLDGVGMNWTNAIRMEIWSRAPRMMVDAPSGWGSYIPGAAYLDWYQPLNVFALTPTLINDHLTWLVANSWTGRFLYAFAAFSILSASLLVAVFKRNPLPLAVWTAFALAASFNPVGHRWVLWAIPVAACISFIGGEFWRRKRVVLGTLTAVASLSTISVAVLFWLGTVEPKGYVPVRFDGKRVYVNGSNPKIWIVDDGTLGGGLTGKDIREFYSCVRHAPAVGYVRSVGDLPDSVARLVLAGHAGADWLMKLSEDEEARNRLPKSVLFISPPFSPSQVPEGVLALCRPRIVVGEFAALYDEEYAKPLNWVTIVPGMEKYILRWMQYVMEF